MPKTTDTSEKALETIIFDSLVNNAGYQTGNNENYLREYALDLEKLLIFLETTQPQVVEILKLNREGPRQKQFLHRLQGEITKRGVIDVLRKGIKHGPASVELFYGSPSPGNIKAEMLFAANIFSITRQLRYSRTQTHQALDLCLFINGLPIDTFELKNKLTKQTVYDAVHQYKRSRKPNELLFQFSRCMVHFAVDDHEVRMCTHLKGDDSWFLPFNKGYNDGAGNPPNPLGIATDYLWKQTLTRESLTDILENYAQVVVEKDEKGKKKKNLYLEGANRDRLDPILDACMAVYYDDLDEDQQVDFKGKGKTFNRTYNFLAAILPYSSAEWEKLSIFLNFLIPKLPAPREEDLSQGILEAIDMDSYRIEVRSELQITLPDDDSEIGPVPTSGVRGLAEPELDLLSNIIDEFNNLFGNIDWKDEDKIRKIISEEIPMKVKADQAYRNAVKHSDRQNARIEHDKALQRVMIDLITDHTELFRQFSDDPAFKNWLSNKIFQLTYLNLKDQNNFRK